jgi:predicted hotdog family 3-hydroxylacyl-ACP dehydratase
MCLIEEVMAWDADRLSCRTNSHRAPGNPLRHDDALHAIHAVEYAGQASALHGALIARADGRDAMQGLLVATTAVELLVDRLDTLSGTLEIQVNRLFGDAQNAIYDYRLECDGQPVSSGRLTIMAQASG